MRKPLLFIALLGLLLGARPAAVAQATNKDLAGSATLSPEHTTLLRALQAAGLADQAKAKGPYTVFAPTNEAFDKLPAGTLDDLLLPANKQLLSSILTYHVVPGHYPAAALKDGQQLKTVQGELLTVKKQGDSIMLVDAKGGSATVQQADIVATNGVVHSIDAVLMPSK
ncbi:fasciclin domain-containing protein [Hymenobacter nivis]|uniref:Fasciclin domain-containing protein n=1 Tax=Hymenobacter nivis TaxID=1850093 RepID=A0A502GM34_9BACT|nr:fasciclin domain-containing protein [Hymenobacter nivis]TPG62901.1 fasciclin domain-containing protein [Hymenobacter nivis]